VTHLYPLCQYTYSTIFTVPVIVLNECTIDDCEPSFSHFFFFHLNLIWVLIGQKTMGGGKKRVERFDMLHSFLGCVNARTAQ